MRIIRDIREMQAASRAATSQGLTIGFVPTMGALHDGHISLVRRARALANLVVVSIFVNPLQFGPAEDFNKYPRALEADSARLDAEGVEIVFAPSSAQMYPAGATTVVYVEGLSEKLDGRSRPGHFRGVSTVVAKLFHIVQPDFAVFGQKDAAQVAVLRRMVRDLNMEVQLIVSPIVREADGLALSSRNAYLGRRPAPPGAGSAPRLDAGRGPGQLRPEQRPGTALRRARRSGLRARGQPRLLRNRRSLPPSSRSATCRRAHLSLSLHPSAPPVSSTTFYSRQLNGSGLRQQILVPPVCRHLCHLRPTLRPCFQGDRRSGVTATAALR